MATTNSPTKLSEPTLKDEENPPPGAGIATILKPPAKGATLRARVVGVPLTDLDFSRIDPSSGEPMVGLWLTPIEPKDSPWAKYNGRGMADDDRFDLFCLNNEGAELINSFLDAIGASRRAFWTGEGTVLDGLGQITRIGGVWLDQVEVLAIVEVREMEDPSYSGEYELKVVGFADAQGCPISGSGEFNEGPNCTTGNDLIELGQAWLANVWKASERAVASVAEHREVCGRNEIARSHARSRSRDEHDDGDCIPDRCRFHFDDAEEAEQRRSREPKTDEGWKLLWDRHVEREEDGLPCPDCLLCLRTGDAKAAKERAEALNKSLKIYRRNCTAPEDIADLQKFERQVERALEAYREAELSEERAIAWAKVTLADRPTSDSEPDSAGATVPDEGARTGEQAAGSERQAEGEPPLDGGGATRRAPFAETAIQHLDAGWPVFPVVRGKKKPAMAGVTGHEGQDRSRSEVEALIPEMGSCNVGLRMPLDVIGLDVDAYDGKAGGSTLEDLEARLGPLPSSPVLTNRDDGVSGQSFYRVPLGTVLRGVAGPGIDILQRHHRFAVGAGSVHPSGRVYRWVEAAIPNPAALPYLPDSWVNALTSSSSSSHASHQRTGSGTEGQRARDTSTDPKEWLKEYGAGEPDAEMSAALNRFLDELKSSCRHDAALSAVYAMVSLAVEGHSGGSDALGLARAAFISAVTADKTRTQEEAQGEWARMLTGAIQIAAVRQSADAGADDKGFWAARAALAAVERFARARRMAPWALLGTVLARIAAATPPTYVLPPTRGHKASLNVCVALCGESGGGKSSAMSAASEILGLIGGEQFLTTNPGTGEGIVRAYVRRLPEREGGGIEQHETAVLFECDEVSTLGALLTRHGATLPGIVKSAWYGGRLGFQNADRARNLQVGAHAYRLALVVGSQPELADVIFDDVAGGLPQRFLWLPTFDSGRLSADDEVEAPASLTWRPPNHVFAGEHVMMLPKEATQAILRAAEAENRPIGSASPDASLDGHALLNRAKVAALLALWDDRDHVNPEDWKLAGTVMAVSMRTRDEMRKALFAKARRGNLQRGRSEAERNAIIMDAEGERKVGVHRASQWLLSWSGWTSTPQSESAIKRRARSGLREHVGSALKVLTLSGQLVMDEDGRYSKVGP